MRDPHLGCVLRQCSGDITRQPHASIRKMANHRLLTACWLVILGTVPAASGAAISYVQGAVAVSARRQIEASTTFPSTQSAGDLDLVFVAWMHSEAEVVSVSDTSGNLYLRAGAISY